MAKSKLFSRDGSIDVAFIENVLSALKDICKEAEITDPVFITYKELCTSPDFATIAKDYGFECSQDIYFGKSRGMNTLEKRNIIVMGGLLPSDADIALKQALSLGGEVKYEHGDIFHVHAGVSGLLEVSSDDLGLSSYYRHLEDRLGKGCLARQVYLESSVQAIRARLFHHDVAAVIFSHFPLSDFGIYATELITRQDFDKRAKLLSKTAKTKGQELSLLLDHPSRFVGLTEDEVYDIRKTANPDWMGTRSANFMKDSVKNFRTKYNGQVDFTVKTGRLFY